MLVDVHLNWLNWFHLLVLEGGQLVNHPFYDYHLLISVVVFVIGGFVWYVLAAPYPPLFLYFFIVNNIIICSEISFS